jgi:hypothetical protein
MVKSTVFLTTVVRHRDPRLLWPVAGGLSVVAHGLALAMVRTLALQTPTLPDGAMAPLPVQLVTLSPQELAQESAATAIAPDNPTPADLDSASTDVPSPEPEAAEAEAAQPPASESTVGDAAVWENTAPFVESRPVQPAPQPRPDGAIAPPNPQPPAAHMPVVPAPRPTPPPQVSTPPVVPAPPRPVAPPSDPVPPPAVVPPPDPGLPGAGGAPTEAAPVGQGGQLVPVSLRLNPSGRDIPDVPPQLLGATAIELRPLVSGCGLGNLDALLAGMVSTTVQMQIRVETSGDISAARLLQSTGSAAVDDLVGCVVRQRLRLQPATTAGVPQLTDAFILDARIQFF